MNIVVLTLDWLVWGALGWPPVVMTEICSRLRMTRISLAMRVNSCFCTLFYLIRFSLSLIFMCFSNTFIFCMFISHFCRSKLRWVSFHRRFSFSYLSCTCF